MNWLSISMNCTGAPTASSAGTWYGKTFCVRFGSASSGRCHSHQHATDQRGKPRGCMSTDMIDLTRLGGRLAIVRRTYGDSIDLPNLGAALFAVLLGVPAATYQSYESGEAEPTVDFLVTLRKK